MSDTSQKSSRINLGVWGWIAGAAAVGGIAYYLFDPKKGSQRRAAIKDKAMELADKTSEYSGKVFNQLKDQGNHLLSKAATLTDSPEDMPMQDRVEQDRKMPEISQQVSAKRTDRSKQLQ